MEYFDHLLILVASTNELLYEHATKKPIDKTLLNGPADAITCVVPSQGLPDLGGSVIYTKVTIEIVDPQNIKFDFIDDLYAKARAVARKVFLIELDGGWNGEVMATPAKETLDKWRKILSEP